MEQIKSNEVRLGNWVNFKSVMGGNENRPLKITINDFVEMANPAWEHCYTGIPLTEEILLKMGFVLKNKNANAYAHKVKGRYGYLNDGVFTFVPLYSTPITTVHGLQNLFFAIYQEELEFEL
jgi:hypothetical protein